MRKAEYVKTGPNVKDLLAFNGPPTRAYAAGVSFSPRQVKNFADDVRRSHKSRRNEYRFSEGRASARPKRLATTGLLAPEAVLDLAAGQRH
jgi:hypothetical protein